MIPAEPQTHRDLASPTQMTRAAAVKESEEMSRKTEKREREKQVLDSNGRWMGEEKGRWLGPHTNPSL